MVYFQRPEGVSGLPRSAGVPACRCCPHELSRGQARTRGALATHRTPWPREAQAPGASRGTAAPRAGRGRAARTAERDHSPAACLVSPACGREAVLRALALTGSPDGVGERIVDLAFDWFGGDGWATLGQSDGRGLAWLCDRGVTSSSAERDNRAGQPRRGQRPAGMGGGRLAPRSDAAAQPALARWRCRCAARAASWACWWGSTDRQSWSLPHPRGRR